MKSSLISVLKSAVGTKRKNKTGGSSAQPGTATHTPSLQHPSNPAVINAASYSVAPVQAAPIYAPPFIYPHAPAPPMPTASPADSAVGLVAGGMALTTPAAFRAVLGVSDLRWIGLPPTLDEPEVSVEEGNGVSAAWTADLEVPGGIELELFSAARSDPARILQLIVKDGDGAPAPVQLSGADEAYEAQADQHAWLAARRGPLVFGLSIPLSPRASQQLSYLGGLVLHRVSAG
jgi:hypothetical protein